ncbi:MAG: chitinase, partial [Cryptosporangiaceae bacterium]|nr:chitinase [Cryptosporangiaceae bacterium]
MRRLKKVTVAFGAVSTLALGMGAVLTATPGSAAVAPLATNGGVKIAYYTQWSMYGNAFYPKNLDTLGVAGKTTILQYAFENVDPVNKT